MPVDLQKVSQPNHATYQMSPTLVMRRSGVCPTASRDTNTSVGQTVNNQPPRRLTVHYLLLNLTIKDFG